MSVDPWLKRARELKAEHPEWGGQSIRKQLVTEGFDALPSAATVARRTDAARAGDDRAASRHWKEHHRDATREYDRGRANRTSFGRCRCGNRILRKGERSCRRCQQRAVRDARRAVIAAGVRARKSNGEIARELSPPTTPNTVAVEVQRMRREGVELPYRGGQGPKRRVRGAEPA